MKSEKRKGKNENEKRKKQIRMMKNEILNGKWQMKNEKILFFEA